MNNTIAEYEKYISTPPVLVNLLVQKDAEIAELNRNVQIFQKALIEAQRAKFAPKSEKRPLVDPNQLPLFPEIVIEPPHVTPRPIEVPAHTRAARTKRDISKLPHQQIVHEPESKLCSCCGKELVCLGTDVSKELEYQPAKLFVNEHVRPRYACNSCKNGVQQAPLPAEAKPLARSIAGAGLLTQVIVAKYVDHIPLNRQEQIFNRKGFTIPRKNMCDWICGVTEQYLVRLWEALKAEILEESYLQGDETTLKIQDGVVPGKCHTGYLWGVCALKKKLVYFEYAESRAGAVAREIFKDFTGTLQTDAYAGYNQVLLPDKVVRIACLAHVRRKFIDAEKTSPKEASAVLSLIAELYRLEQQWRGLEPPERKVKRDKESVPILLKLEVYLRALITKTLPNAPLAAAISYTLKQWAEIKRILEDGRYELDNNPIEREMRPIAVGRKNYLFAGSHDGARHAAIIYSLFATAKQHKVNPAEWLKYVLTHMREHPVNKISELLPHRFRA